MKKYGQNEPLEVFRGKEAAVVNDHMQKVGKAVSDFDSEQLDALRADLQSVSDQEPKVTKGEPEQDVDPSANGKENDAT